MSPLNKTNLAIQRIVTPPRRFFASLMGDAVGCIALCMPCASRFLATRSTQAALRGVHHLLPARDSAWLSMMTFFAHGLLPVMLWSAYSTLTVPEARPREDVGHLSLLLTTVPVSVYYLPVPHGTEIVQGTGPFDRPGNRSD